MIDVYYYQSGQLFQAVASATGEDSARGHVGQCLLLQASAGSFVALQCGISYGKCQCGKAFIGGDELVYFVEIHSPQWSQRGAFHGFSGRCILYG